jgi:hypothetical protein
MMLNVSWLEVYWQQWWLRVVLMLLVCWCAGVLM